jgi:hypothetical protein
MMMVMMVMMSQPLSPGLHWPPSSFMARSDEAMPREYARNKYKPDIEVLVGRITASPAGQSASRG